MLSFPNQAWSHEVQTVRRSPLDALHAGRAASEIMPRLYLSDLFTARDKDTLRRLGITHIITLLEHDHRYVVATEEEETSLEDDQVGRPRIRRMRVGIADRPDVDILSWLDKTTEFIETALLENATNAVLVSCVLHPSHLADKAKVHCLQGISRSATVACAYIISKTGKSGPEAIKYVQSKRGIVCPNLGFRQQLDTFATRFVGSKRPGGRTTGGKRILGLGISSRISMLRGSGPRS